MQNQLITITTQQIGQYEIPAVDGRELHGFLEVQTKFTEWIARRIEEYDFIEESDFFSSLGKSLSASNLGRPRIEYTLSTDMAKELCMVERTERGKEARRYFIECERKLKQSGHSPHPDQITAARSIYDQALDIGSANIAHAAHMEIMKAMGREPEQSEQSAPSEPTAKPEKPVKKPPVSAKKPPVQPNLPAFAGMEYQDFEGLFRVWKEKYPNTVIGASKIHDLIIENDIQIDMKDGNHRSKKIRLGCMLRRIKNFEIGGMKIKDSGTYQGAKQWRILTATPETATPEH